MSRKNKSKSKDGSWRYQAVFAEHTNDLGGTYNCLTICEVYLDEDEKLEAWTENSSIAPSGDTLDELAEDLQCMLDDIRKWEPIPYDSLQIGRAFERNL